MFRKPVLVAVALAAFFSFAIAARVAEATAESTADPAAAQIQAFYATLLDTMKHGPELGMQGRFKAMLPAIDKAYDLSVMMQLIIGPGWSGIEEADKAALVAAFRRMTAASYASNFDRFAGERFTVDPNVPQRGGDKIVQTQLIPQGDKPVALIYRMRQTGESWKIIDVYLAGYVSQAALKRSDFASTLASGGPKALAQKINTLADTALAGAKNAQ